MRAPFFSVILTVYNGEHFLQNALESLRRQQFEDWELIAVDDASTDGTARILSSFVATEPRARLITNQKNLHMGAAANVGMRAARGSWLARLDADDQYHPDFLRRMYEEAVSAAPAEFLTCWPRIIDEKGRDLIGIRLPSAASLKRLMPVKNHLYHVATCFPKKLWDLTVGYPEDRIPGSDAVLWRTFFAKGARLRCIPEFLIDYRVHNANYTTSLEVTKKSSARDWMLQLYLKEGLLEDARRELREIQRAERRKNFKYVFYWALTWFGRPAARFMMWEVYPWFRVFKKISK